MSRSTVRVYQCRWAVLRLLGESVSQVFSLDADSRSYATMVIPTNDTFFANANELLDAAGNFNGTQVISLLADAYDSFALEPRSAMVIPARTDQ